MESEVLERCATWAERLFAPESETHRWVLEEEEARDLPRIEVSALEGRLLALVALLAREGGARRILEIGTLGGYSGLWLLSAVPEARLVTLERDPEHARLAREAFRRAGVEERVTLIEGDARDVVPGLRGSERFDLVFVDADKRSYPDYLAWSAELLEPGGVLLADNAFLSGRVLDPEPEDEDAAAMAEFARRLAEDPRFEATVVPIRDGLAVARFAG